MRISIAGEPEKVHPNMCRAAIRYYGKRLLTPRLLELIHIKIVFDDDDLPVRHKGDCQRIEKYTYRIRLHPTFGNRVTLLTLAHEMVHVAQWARGQMKDLSNARCRYNGKVYENHDDYYHYWFNPWEVDAYGMEIGLYKTFWTDNKEKFQYGIRRSRRNKRRRIN